MKKLIAIFFATLSVTLFAQDNIPFAMVNPNSSATYALLRGPKKKLNMGICYYKISVNNIVTKDAGCKQIINRVDILNKKKEISGLSGMIGSKEGFYFAVNLDAQGGYKMDQDLMWGIYPEMARAGFMFEIPAQLSVGQTLQSSTVDQQFKSSGVKMSSSLKYNDVKVVREEDLTVPAGTFHCYVITGTYSGQLGTGSTFNTIKIENSPFTMWIAQGIGVVNFESVYGELCTYELCELTGVQ